MKFLCTLLFGIEQREKTNDLVWDVFNADIDRDLERIRDKPHASIEES